MSSESKNLTQTKPCPFMNANSMLFRLIFLCVATWCLPFLIKSRTHQNAGDGLPYQETQELSVILSCLNTKL